MVYVAAGKMWGAGEVTIFDLALFGSVVFCADQFEPNQLVVIGWSDDPYDQLESGDLITVCNECNKLRKEG